MLRSRGPNATTLSIGVHAVRMTNAAAGHRRAHCLRYSTMRAIFRGESTPKMLASPNRQSIFNRWNEAVSIHLMLEPAGLCRLTRPR